MYKETEAEDMCGLLKLSLLLSSEAKNALRSFGFGCYPINIKQILSLIR